MRMGCCLLMAFCASLLCLAHGSNLMDMLDISLDGACSGKAADAGSFPSRPTGLQECCNGHLHASLQALGTLCVLHQMSQTQEKLGSSVLCT
jgi:hypothetical protein